MIASGILINLLNPKLTIFFFAFLPQFVDIGEPGHVLRMLELAEVGRQVVGIDGVGHGRLGSRDSARFST